MDVSVVMRHKSMSLRRLLPSSSVKECYYKVQKNVVCYNECHCCHQVLKNVTAIMRFYVLNFLLHILFSFWWEVWVGGGGFLFL